ncbi:flagellar protein FliS [Pseudoflavonifractor sp. 524-17]|uniref:flagellar export chaperone FliS n=1 Tax=Pseudoflavonifractor sp. 524-17 TaxID=2304577 RepID=UPI00137AB932|nr:flagellar export chaperone FliS [Pseudoflavonifractor sp. 524-17]NCE65521.1 flagellar protein FliS [Pseudoflavonifractor sp. 524-17]
MDSKGFRGYQDQKDQAINSMTQGELLLLLYDELVKRLTRAELALKKPDYALFDASVDRSLEIIRYLDDTLDRQYPIGRDLARLYDFFSYELNRVKAGRNATELERVRTMADELRGSFRAAEKASREEVRAEG